MSENLSDALIIMAVGMITVFVILALVVFTGRILIRITNRFAPPSKFIDKEVSSPDIIRKPSNSKISSETKFNKKKIAAVVATVDQITQGKGRIENIQKL